MKRIDPPAKNPCGSCPYRRDVPSGVWAAQEYVKLPPYDRDTQYQPAGLFMCHQQDGHVCAGWAGTHDMEGNLAIRIAVAMFHISPETYEAIRNYTTDVPLWDSGTEACAHGLAEVISPGEKALRAIANLERKAGKRDHHERQ